MFKQTYLWIDGIANHSGIPQNTGRIRIYFQMESSKLEHLKIRFGDSIKYSHSEWFLFQTLARNFMGHCRFQLENSLTKCSDPDFPRLKEECRKKSKHHIWSLHTYLSIESKIQVLTVTHAECKVCFFYKTNDLWNKQPFSRTCIFKLPQKVWCLRQNLNISTVDVVNITSLTSDSVVLTILPTNGTTITWCSIRGMR